MSSAYFWKLTSQACSKIRHLVLSTWFRLLDWQEQRKHSERKSTTSHICMWLLSIYDFLYLMQNWMNPLECVPDSSRKWTSNLPHTSKHPYISVALGRRGILQYCLAHFNGGRKSHFMRVIEERHPRNEKIHMPCSASHWLAAVWPGTSPAGGHSEGVGVAFLRCCRRNMGTELGWQEAHWAQTGLRCHKD